MTETRFDQVVARRQAVGGLIGVAAAMLAGDIAGARKRKNGKGKGKGKRKASAKGAATGNGQANGNGNGHGNGLALGRTKLLVCHWDSEAESFQLITIAEPAWKAHEKHGDVTCEDDPCAGAVEPCTVVCDAAGVCIAAGSEEGPAGEE